MGEQNNGGPAFPQPDVPYQSRVVSGNLASVMGGMTLRDYFAGQALIALGALQEEGIGPSDPKIWVASAYRLASVMLEARGE